MIRRYICYILLCMALGIYSIFYESYGLMVVFFFVVFLPIAMASTLFIVKKNIKMSLDIPKNCVKAGENIPFVVTIENRTILPTILLELNVECFNELYGTSNKEKLEIPTLKTGKQVFYFKIRSKYCGNIKICINKFRVIDYFHFFKLSKIIHVEKTVSVMPNVVVLECNEVMKNTSIMIDSDTYSDVQKGNDPQEVFDFREYQIGDELKFINWKMSSKFGKYMIKEMSMPINEKIVILIEMYIPKIFRNIENYMDAIIGTALGISLKLQELKYEHSIVWYDIRTATCRKMEVDESTSLDEVLKNILDSCIYRSELKLLKEYNIEYKEDVVTHMYYVGMSYDENTMDLYINNYENVLKNYILIVENVIESDIYDEFESNKVILQGVDINNLEDSVTSLVL